MTIPLTVLDIGVVRKGSRFKPNHLGADYIFVIGDRDRSAVRTKAPFPSGTDRSDLDARNRAFSMRPAEPPGFRYELLRNESVVG
jgi:hypothetical protein